MKGKVFLLIYGILTCLFIYGRIFGDANLALAKSFVIVPLIAYYTISVKKTDYNFVLVLAFFLLGDTIFALTEYQYIGFSAYFLANTLLSLLILYRMEIFTSKIFFNILVVISTILVLALYLFYENELFQKILLWAFHISIGVAALSAYLRHNKTTKIYTLWMLLATLLFVFCNFMANMNYFFMNNLSFRILISICYIFFLFGITYSMILEDKEHLKVE